MNRRHFFTTAAAALALWCFALDDAHAMPIAWLANRNALVSALFGILAFADAIAVIPKTLAENSGFDPQESFIKLQEAHARGFNDAGFNVDTGEACR
jgi:hypothetical protein